MIGNKDYIGLDVGQARTGFARGSESAKLAEPLETMPTDQAVNKLLQMHKQEPIAAVVVGLPRNLSGDETPQTSWVREWVEVVKDRLDVPFYAQDEALTTKLAEARRFGGKGLHDIDALAAAIILQDFLDTPETERVVW